MGPELRAVLADAPAVTLETASALRFLQGQRRDVLRALSIRVESREMAADDLVGFIAFETPGTGVPAGYVPLGIQHVDRVIGDSLDEEPVAPLASLCGFEAICFFHPIPIPAPAGAGLQFI